MNAGGFRQRKTCFFSDFGINSRTSGEDILRDLPPDSPAASKFADPRTCSCPELPPTDPRDTAPHQPEAAAAAKAKSQSVNGSSSDVTVISFHRRTLALDREGMAAETYLSGTITVARHDSPP